MLLDDSTQVGVQGHHQLEEAPGCARVRLRLDASQDAPRSRRRIPMRVGELVEEDHHRYPRLEESIPRVHRSPLYILPLGSSLGVWEAALRHHTYLVDDQLLGLHDILSVLLALETQEHPVHYLGVQVRDRDELFRYHTQLVFTNLVSYSISIY